VPNLCSTNLSTLFNNAGLPEDSLEVLRRCKSGFIRNLSVNAFGLGSEVGLHRGRRLGRMCGPIESSEKAGAPGIARGGGDNGNNRSKKEWQREDRL
jgi:hypothetical protein